MSFFDKEEYTIADIQSLIDNSIEESPQLDYKAAGALQKTDGKKKEIGKDVSAMANSDGGIIIYGLSEQNHVADSFSYIDGNEFTKEWLEQVISTNVQRRVTDLKIFPIRNNGNIQETIYVVKMPASKNAPHMASDKKFYRRYNFESVPMEEWEVRLSYGKKDNTELEILDLIFSQGGRMGNVGSLRSLDFKVTIPIKNISNAIEDRYKLELSMHPNIFHSFDNNQNLGKYPNRQVGNNIIFSIPSDSSLFQDEQTAPCFFNLRAAIHNKPVLCEFPLSVKLYYSNGTVTRDFILADILTFSGQTIRQIEFMA